MLSFICEVEHSRRLHWLGKCTHTRACARDGMCVYTCLYVNVCNAACTRLSVRVRFCCQVHCVCKTRCVYTYVHASAKASVRVCTRESKFWTQKREVCTFEL